MPEDVTVSKEQLENFSRAINDALLELNVQRRRIMERSGPMAADAQDLGATIENLRTQREVIEKLKPVTKPRVKRAIAAPSAAATPIPKPEVSQPEEEELTKAFIPAESELAQYYIHYWHGLSSDQMEYWVFFYAARPPTQAEASRILERGVKRIGMGYWDLTTGQTEPQSEGLLFRVGENELWGWDSGWQEVPEDIQPGQALARKVKTSNWSSGREAQSPKEVKFVLEPLH